MRRYCGRIYLKSAATCSYFVCDLKGSSLAESCNQLNHESLGRPQNTFWLVATPSQKAAICSRVWVRRSTVQPDHLDQLHPCLMRPAATQFQKRRSAQHLDLILSCSLVYPTYSSSVRSGYPLTLTTVGENNFVSRLPLATIRISVQRLPASKQHEQEQSCLTFSGKHSHIERKRSHRPTPTHRCRCLLRFSLPPKNRPRFNRISICDTAPRIRDSVSER